MVELRRRRHVDPQQVLELAHCDVDRRPGGEADQDGPRGQRHQGSEAEDREHDVEHADHHGERAGRDQELGGAEAATPSSTGSTSSDTALTGPVAR